MKEAEKKTDPPEKADPPKERTVTLDVRWFNATGRKLYLALGFREVERTYPGFYDFHGGVKMRCPMAELASDQKRDRVPLFVERFDIEPFSDFSAK